MLKFHEQFYHLSPADVIVVDTKTKEFIWANGLVPINPTQKELRTFAEKQGEWTPYSRAEGDAIKRIAFLDPHGKE